jgi:hypothetical protein
MASERSRARLEASISSPGKIAFLVSSELLQTRDDNLRQVALLVTIGNLDGFVELAFAQRAGNRRSKRARLIPRPR